MNTYNFNRIHIVFMAFAILLLASSVWATGTYDDGDGSQGDPFQVNTPAQMDEIGQHSEDWGSYFLLTADINLSEYTGTEFNIIGNNIDQFTGVFDGNDHTISNFTYTSTGTDYIALFGYLGRGGQIKDLGMTDPNVNAGTGINENHVRNVGSLVGYSNEGTIDNCYSIRCTVRAGDLYASNVGGLIGLTYNSTISNCNVAGFVTGGSRIGGLVGRQRRGSMTNCHATGTVAGFQLVGGLVGTNGVFGGSPYGGLISNCYASAIVQGCWNTGGLVGWNSFARISNCYSTGSVVDDPQANTLTSSIGGLAGGLDGNDELGTIENSNSSSSVTATAPTIQHVGGLVGYCSGVVNNCYATGDVFTTGSNSQYIGGLLGDGTDSTVNNSYATGSVVGELIIGGLAGQALGTISNCYATGNVTGDSVVGGLAGWAGTINNSYATGNVTGISDVGGLAALCVTDNSFWDMETGGPNNGYGTPLSTDDMQDPESFISAGWDFVSESANGTDNNWRLCVDGIKYPELAWQSITADLACPAGVDFGDFAFFASRWLEIDCDTSNDCGGSDMDLSTDVGSGDLQLFLGNWLADSL